MRLTDPDVSVLSTTRWPHVITGLGGLLGLGVAGEVVAVVTLGIPAPSGMLVGVPTSLPFVAGLIYGGYWLVDSEVPAERYPRIGGWCVAGLSGFVLIIVGILLREDSLPWLYLAGAGRWAASLGGGIGLVIGIFEARAIERTRAAERAQVHRQAVQRERDRLEEFASVVAHDLRNPLNIASGHLALAQEECDSSHLDKLATAHGRMEAIIEDTLDLAREGQTVGETTPVDVVALSERCWQTVETTNAALHTDESVTVEADRDRLQHVFENLFRNATDHGGEEVTVRVGALADMSGFYVEDDGPGIPRDQREDVFGLGHTTADVSNGSP